MMVLAVRFVNASLWACAPDSRPIDTTKSMLVKDLCFSASFALASKSLAFIS